MEKSTIKKILIVSHSSQKSGGAESDFERLLNYFSSFKDKYEMYCILPAGDGLKKYISYCEDYKIIKEGVFPTFYLNFTDYIKYFVKGIIQVYGIRKFINNYKFDIVIFNVSVLTLPFLYLKHRKLKNIIFIREFVKPDFCRKFVYKILSYSSNYIFAVSDSIRKDYIKITNNKNIRTIFSAIGEEEFKEFYSPHNLIELNDKKNNNVLLSPNIKLLNIGPVCKLKNQLLIIEALNIMKTRGDTMPVFINIGDFNLKSNYVQMLIKKINNYRLNDYCYFFGYLDRKITYSIINKIDTIIISSLSEGMPLVLVEAMKFGKPVIATNIQGVSEIIIDLYNGLLIDIEPGKLAENIKKLMTDNNLKDNIINNAKETAEKYFNLNKNLSVIESAINKIVKAE